MSYNYTNNHNHPYTNTAYQQRTKVPDSVLNFSNTPLKQTLIRNQSFQNRKYNDDLIQLIAKIRSLQDDLINERFKNQTLQRKLLEYEKVIQNLQYEITSQNYQIHKYQRQMQLSNQKNIQILKYEQNLKLVGQEIQEINNVLMIKNKQYDAIQEKNKNLEFQIKKAHEENHLLKVNQSIWKKQLDLALQEASTILLQIKENNSKPSLNTMKQVSSVRSQQNFKPYLSPDKYQLKNMHQSNEQNSISFNYNNPNQQISKRIQVMKQLFSQLSNQHKSLSKQHQNVKKQLTGAFLKQKQKNIKIQYEYKLQQERIKDLYKRQPDINASLEKQKQVEIIMENMLKKEDQYISRIQQNAQQIENLKTYISQLEQGNQYVQNVQLKQKKSIIQALLRQKKIFQEDILQLNQRLALTQQKYHELSMMTERQTQYQQKNNLMLHKKIRKVQEENIQLKIKIDELLGEVSLLNREIQILKRNDQGPQLEEQGHHQAKISIQ